MPTRKLKRVALVENLHEQLPDPIRVEVCDTFWSRFRGLMFRRRMPSEAGVLLVGGQESRWDSAIHMLFVRFDLAVFWINSDMRVVDKVLAKAWRPAYVPRQAARLVLELHSDRYSCFKIGDKVKIIND